MGTNKALLDINRELLWRRQLSVLRALEPDELFIAGPMSDDDSIPIPDAQPDSGPLAGVVSGLRRCSAPLLLVLAVDLPRMTSKYLRELLETSGEQGAVPRDQPLVAVYLRGALSLAERFLADNEYSMRNFARACIAQQLATEVEIAPEDEGLFLNLNTPEDLLLVTNA